MAISWVEPKSWSKKRRGYIPRPVLGEWAAWYFVAVVLLVITKVVEPIIFRRPLEDGPTLLRLALMNLVVIIPAPWISRWFAKGVINITREGVRYEFADFKGSEVFLPWSRVGSFALSEEGEQRVLVLRGPDGDEIERYALAPKVDEKELQKTIGWYRTYVKRREAEKAMKGVPSPGSV